MNIFKKIYIRLYQKILFIFSLFIKYREPTMIKGENSFNELANLLASKGYKNVFLITGKKIHTLNFDSLISNELTKHNINYVLYYNFQVDPTINEIEEGVKLYNEKKCDCIVAIGGGSIMDGAKCIGIRVSNKNKTLLQMKGLLKVKNKAPLTILIPTTAGTGSEVSVAAVVLNEKTAEKFPIEDFKLIPEYIILNPILLKNLPNNITAYTGMDALTHAVEAYLNNSNTKNSKTHALNAINLIFNNLYESYKDNENLIAKENMQIAAYEAGIAFSKAYVGYVHALAHAIGGYYNVPHGLANAILLPLVLKEYGSKAYKKLAQIYDYVFKDNNFKTQEEKAKFIINYIENLNKEMNITNNFKDIIKKKDIDLLIKRAIKESIPLYPVVKLFTYENFLNVLNEAIL